MKKLAAVFVALILMFASFGPVSAFAEVKELTHWSWGNGATYGAAWELFVQKHPEYADVEYTFVSQGGSSQGMMKEIMLSYAAGAALPDVIEMNFKLAPMLIDDGVVADITDIVSEYKDKVPAYVWNSASKDGRMYGIPLRGNSSMMLYREDLCAAAGVDVSAIKTWDDFFAAGKQFQEYYNAKGEDVNWTTISAEKPCDYWGEILFGQQDIGFYDENGECTVDTDPQALEALKTIYRIYEEGFAMTLTDLTPSWYAALAEGKVGCILTAGWMPTILMQNVPDGAGMWRIAPYPTFANGNQSMQGTMGYCILTQDPEKAKLAAQVLIETAYDDEACYDLENKAVATNMSLTVFANKPIQSEVIDGLNAYFGGQDVKGVDLQILNQATLHHYTPAFSETLSILNSEMSKAISGQKTVDEAITDMGKIIRQQIGTSKY